MARRRKKRVYAKRRKVTRRRRVHVRNITTFKGVGRRVKVEKGADGRERIVAVRVFNSRTRRWRWKHRKNSDRASVMHRLARWAGK